MTFSPATWSWSAAGGPGPISAGAAASSGPLMAGGGPLSRAMEEKFGLALAREAAAVEVGVVSPAPGGRGTGRGDGPGTHGQQARQVCLVGVHGGEPCRTRATRTVPGGPVGRHSAKRRNVLAQPCPVRNGVVSRKAETTSGIPWAGRCTTRRGSVRRGLVRDVPERQLPGPFPLDLGQTLTTCSARSGPALGASRKCTAVPRGGRRSGPRRPGWAAGCHRRGIGRTCSGSAKISLRTLRSAEDDVAGWKGAPAFALPADHVTVPELGPGPVARARGS